MADTERQIRQMAEFIRLEAKEKAAEIRAKVCLTFEDMSRNKFKVSYFFLLNFDCFFSPDSC